MLDPSWKLSEAWIGQCPLWTSLNSKEEVAKPKIRSCADRSTITISQYLEIQGLHNFIISVFSLSWGVLRNCVRLTLILYSLSHTFSPFSPYRSPYRQIFDMFPANRLPVLLQPGGDFTGTSLRPPKPQCGLKSNAKIV